MKRNASVASSADEHREKRRGQSHLGAFPLNLRFPGQLFDRESNLHYNYFRDYNPQTGRYVQSDPIGLQGGINTYAYVEGNPVSFSDFLGLMASRVGKCWSTTHSWTTTARRTAVEKWRMLGFYAALASGPALNPRGPESGGRGRPSPPVEPNVFDVWLVWKHYTRYTDYEREEFWRRVQAWCSRFEIDECGQERERLDIGNPVDSQWKEPTPWRAVGGRTDTWIEKLLKLTP
jgi:RHS repeat-associated protein